MASAGNIEIKLTANAAEFISGVQRAMTQASSLGTLIGTQLSNALTRAGSAFLGLAQNTLQFGDEMNKASQKIGISVETLSALKYAGELADVSFGDLGASLARMSRAAAGATTEAKEQASAFGRLGISVRDASGHFRGSEEILGDIADRFAKLPDGIQKTAIAQDLFGKSGARLIPLLNEGREGLARSAEEARRLGLVLSTEAARASEQFNDNMTRLQGLLQGIANRILTAALPTLNTLAQAFVDAGKNASGIQGDFDGLDRVFRRLASTAVFAAGVIQTAWSAIKSAGALGTFGFTTLSAEMGRIGVHFNETWANAKNLIFELEDGLGVRVPAAARTGDGALAQQAANLEAVRRKIKEILDSIDRAVSASELALARLIGVRQPEPERAGFQSIAAQTREFQAALAVQVTLNRAQGEFIARTRSGQLPSADIVREALDAQAGRAKLMVAALEEAKKKGAEFRREFASDMRELGQRVGKSLEDAIIHFQGFGNVLRTIGEELARLLIKVTLIRPLLKAFEDLLGGGKSSGSGGGGFFGTLLGGIASVFGLGRAAGGDVSAGHAYIVGERRPELFVPRVSGTIVPNISGIGAGRGQTTVVYNIDARGAGPGTAAEIRRALEQVHAAAVRDSVLAVRDLSARGR